jgi:hypothetical protein
MVPCYIDMFYPHVGMAALELLEELHHDGHPVARTEKAR